MIQNNLNYMDDIEEGIYFPFSQYLFQMSQTHGVFVFKNDLASV